MYKIALVMTVAVLAVPAVAQDTSLAAAFGAREGVQSASLSPDGSKIALIASGPQQTTKLFIVDTAGGGPKSILTASGKPERLDRCRWVAATRLVCNVYSLEEYAGEIMGSSTVIAIDSDGQNVRRLSVKRSTDAKGWDLRGGSVIDYLPEQDGTVLMMRSYVPEERVDSFINKTDEGMGVDRIDTRTGAVSKVENAQRDADEFITDGHGTVRIKGVTARNSVGYDLGSRKYLYRPKGSREWQTLSTYTYSDQSGFIPSAVDRDGNLAYGFEKVGGRFAAVTYSLDDARSRSIIYQHPSVDVDGLVQVGRRGRVIGVSYATDRRSEIYFDTALNALTVSLSKALGGKSVYISDTSLDESKVLVWAGADTDPGKYYLFDRTLKKLTPVIPQRPQLDGKSLAPVQAITYPASDGTMVPAYLTLPPGKDARNLRAIVLPHGGPSARDEWGFDWLSQYFAARGFAVIQPNFRGSFGYGEAWLQKNGFKSWRIAIGDVVSAGKYLVAKGIADPKKLGILGWSYGGYAALQAAVIEPDVFKAVVAIAPITDFGTLLDKARYSNRFYVMKDYVGSGPHLVEGSPARNAERIKAPVLMFQGTLDGNVSQQQPKLMDQKLKAAGNSSQLVLFDGLDQRLDDEAARTTILQRSGDFLEAAGN